MYARVIVDISNDAVDRVFDYVALPDTMVGMRVRVPFANRTVLGYVISLSEETSVDKTKIKSIIANLESVPKIKPEILDLSMFLARHFFLRLSDCIKLVLPSCVRLDTEREQTEYVLSTTYDTDTAINIIGKRAKSQLSAFLFVSEQGEVKFSTALEHFGRSSINALVEKGILLKTPVRKRRMPSVDDTPFEKKTLTPLQESAVNTIDGKDETFLLQGVTGSGKTEVYMSVIDRALSRGQTAIMLVPEISLTPQMMQRFNSRFPGQVAVLHSGLSEGERFDEWDRIFSGEARVVLGARSAIFAPLEHLGVIIIDEEHDSSYVSESNPRFDTLDVAEFRARYHRCPLILGSATPSIKSYKLAQDRKYHLVRLPERINGLEMPKLEIVDMLNEVLDGNTSTYSRKLLSKLDECIQNKKQAILFINRRGFASFVMCRECGHRVKCDDCEVSLVYHKEDNELKCHFCGKRYRSLTNCPNCHSTNIKYGALGTERVCEDLKQMFPDVPIFRMDNDTTRGKNGHKNILEQFSKTTPSILVGTQMIAKGHDYPNVAFVGILDADVSLYNSDYKANERTFQLVTQVAGRAGRKNNDGYVVLQTYAPKHYVYRFASNYDYESFFDKENNLRQATAFPPYSNIIRILVSSESDHRAKEVTKKLYDEALKLKEKHGHKIFFLQAMPSPVKRIQTKYRYQILTRCEPDDKITCDFYAISDIIEKDVSIFVEVNPNNLR
ncbi:MAG: primosomal protein N' [Clostridiales bacterium]|nr:primosomal protein N' [Clostridiales bacterium]